MNSGESLLSKRSYFQDAIDLNQRVPFREQYYAFGCYYGGPPMGSENVATPIFSFATPERLKSFNGGPQNLYAVVSKETLGFTSSLP